MIDETSTKEEVMEKVKKDLDVLKYASKELRGICDLILQGRHS